MLRRVAFVVPLVDSDVKLAEQIQQSPVIGRMSDGVGAVVALSVEKTRIRTMVDEQVDDLHQADLRSPLHCGGVTRSSSLSVTRTQADSTRARISSVFPFCGAAKMSSCV
jgi:hypothetical protein